MVELDKPDSADDLWRARGDEVSVARPLMQGDVILLEDGPVCVVAHPCSMRRGTTLHEDQTVAGIESKQIGIWRGNLDWMPLPGLEISGVEHPAANLRALRRAPTAELRRAPTIGAMSDQGIHLLQQRLACHLTRVVIDLAELAAHSAPELAEAELIEEWVEEFGDIGEQRLNDLLEADDRKLRSWLREARTRPQAIRAARKAMYRPGGAE